jgi:hypothetical protein
LHEPLWHCQAAPGTKNPDVREMMTNTCPSDKYLPNETVLPFQPIVLLNPYDIKDKRQIPYNPERHRLPMQREFLRNCHRFLLGMESFPLSNCLRIVRQPGSTNPEKHFLNKE